MWVGLQEDAHRQIAEANATSDSYKQWVKKVKYWQEHHPTWMSR
jgi:hypothetical protein